MKIGKCVKNTLILLMLFCISSFAAIVSDDDSSVFVTKSEFDSLKEDFTTQIKNYNDNIEYKIDGAVNSYLARMDLQVENEVESNFDIFTWPLNIINKLNVIENCTTSATNLSEQQTLWSPAYELYATAWRQSNLWTEKFEWNQVDKIENYLNGTANTSDGTFKVEDICYKPTLKFTNTIVHECCGGDGSSTLAFANSIYMDATGNPSYGSGNWWYRNAVMNDYYGQYRADTYAPHFTGFHHAGYGNQVYMNTENIKNRYDSVYVAGYGLGINQFASAWDPDQLQESEYTYQTKKLDRIYNYGDSTNQSHFAPTTSNYVLLFTNKKANRRQEVRDKRICWYVRNDNTSTNQTLKWIITPGENLEHEKEDTSRAWYNKSLISSNRVVYDYNTPDGGLVANHKMVNGIPIFYGSEDLRADGYENIKITFDLNTSKTDNDKYLIVSTKPITTQNYADDVSSISDYFTIEMNNSAPINSKKCKLVQGTNVISLSKDQLVKKGETIYIKILWNDTNEEMVSISKPRIKYLPK